MNIFEEYKLKVQSSISGLFEVEGDRALIALGNDLKKYVRSCWLDGILTLIWETTYEERN